MMAEALRQLLDLLKWIARRPRLAVRIICDDTGSEEGLLEFEIENRSATVTSLEPKVTSDYYVLSKMRIERRKMTYFVREVDRRLEPHAAKILTATPDHRSQIHTHSWYRVYRFKPSWGIPTKVRIRNALLEPLGTIRFLSERLRFRFSGKVPEDQLKSIDDFKRLKRSQGPH